ncbi:MAG: asparagine synthase (glutamine-hydrolyzing) [Candidatus Riflebacteria bacterium]|nr:asparagine synthase (glutamine-hydrolyzing) [Candidatus Riflebacteria bacterium]
MCGIVSIISPNPDDHAALDRVTDALFHRGPDSRGTWREGNVSLGHRRLSIIDLSPNGAQPMFNEDKSLALVCNGEIYNYLELMDELQKKGHRFRSVCDCETLLHLYEEKELNFLDDVNGMFALCLWDARKKRLIAAVDRFGKRPLYWARNGERFAFASELKALYAFPWWERTVEPLAIDRYLALRYVPAPMTIFKGVRKLEMATLMIVESANTTFKTYWQARSGDEFTTQEQFEETLTEAVRLRLRSDVPLGIYLSGGVDSAAIAALMAEHTAGPKISYSVGFDYEFDERPRAKLIADHLGFEYNALTIDAGHFDLLPKITYHLDEPFGDLICLPAFTLAERAKQKLTVVLTGDGADEILSGYFHQKLMTIRQRYEWLSRKSNVRSVFSRLMESCPCSILTLLFDYPDKIGPNEKSKFLHAIASSGQFGTFYEAVTSCFSASDKNKLYRPGFYEALNGPSLGTVFQHDFETLASFPLLARLSLLDIKHWIPFSVLFRLDKMNMAHAVETRSPFLDYQVVQKCLNLSDNDKLASGRNKIALRRLIERLLPSSLRTPGKQAFYFPQTNAYRERYLSWAKDLVTPENIRRRGLFDQSAVEAIVRQAQGPSMLATRQLTALAMLESWFQVHVDARPDESRLARA